MTLIEIMEHLAVNNYGVLPDNAAKKIHNVLSLRNQSIYIEITQTGFTPEQVKTEINRVFETIAKRFPVFSTLVIDDTDFIVHAHNDTFFVQAIVKEERQVKDNLVYIRLIVTDDEILRECKEAMPLLFPAEWTSE